jgi:hypothetical protein
MQYWQVNNGIQTISEQNRVLLSAMGNVFIVNMVGHLMAIWAEGTLAQSQETKVGRAELYDRLRRSSLSCNKLEVLNETRHS